METKKRRMHKMVKIGHARHDERGKYSAGTAGDNTGSEVTITNWYRRGWNVVLRAKSKFIAKDIAIACVDACNNDNIGYDQLQRTTLYDEAEKVEFNIRKVKKTVETDCSALVAVCINAAGIKVSKNIYTGNMVNAIMRTGQFELLKDKKYLDSPNFLQAGDILVYEGHHTAIVVSDRNGVIVSRVSKAKEPKIEPKTTNKKTVEEIAQEVIRGKWGVGQERAKKLKAAGYDPVQVQRVVNVLMR